MEGEVRLRKGFVNGDGVRRNVVSRAVAYISRWRQQKVTLRKMGNEIKKKKKVPMKQKDGYFIHGARELDAQKTSMTSDLRAKTVREVSGALFNRVGWLRAAAR